MIVGILSDTHGRAVMARLAVKLLLQHHAEYLIHCGDVGTKQVLDELAGHPATFVFGNNDYDHQGFAQYAIDLGITCGGSRANLQLGNKTAVVTHGDDQRLVRDLLLAQQIDYLFLGHTHECLSQRSGRVHVINPGALYRATVKTVAILNTETDEVRFLPVAE